MLGSFLRRLFADLSALIYDDGCIICGEHVDEELEGLCMRCRFEMPVTRYSLQSDNPVKEYFESIMPIVEASSFLHFKTDDRWRRMIHRLKYNNEWRLGLTFGEMYGAELKKSGLSEYIAEGISHELGAKVDRSTVYRRRNNPSQTKQRSLDRWSNVDNLFAVRNPKRLQHKHILLVDDVLTTGATLTSCLYAIQRDAPTCRVSIATLAVAGRIKR